MEKPAPPAPYAPGKGFNPKPGLDGKGDMGDPKKSGRQHRRTLASPCDRPPAVPQNVQMRFRAVEAKTHLNFKGRIVWDDVTTDSSGIPINTVDRWDIEWRAIDDDGDPVEVEHSALIHATMPFPDDRMLFTTGRDISPTTHGGYEWHVGDRVKVRGCFPETNYNGTWTITDIPAANQFVVQQGTAGTPPAKRPGEVYNLSTDQSYRRKLRNPQPRMPLRKAEMIVDTSDHSNIVHLHNPSGFTYRIETGPTNDYQIGDWVKIENASPNPYNGIWRVTSRLDANTFDVAGDTSSVAAGTSGDVYIATTVYQYTTRGANGFNNGDRVRIVGNRPELDYNGTWQVTATPGDTMFKVQPNRDPDDPLNDAETLGVVYDQTDALHLVINHVPRPKTWSWQARVRCRSGEGCWSAFSPWTDPILPFDGAEPLPPAPDYGAFPITFDHKNRGKYRKFRLLFTFDEVLNWDVPGGDREEDVAAYGVQISHSSDGINWDDPPYRHQTRTARDGDADTTVTVVFQEIHRHYWYRCRVRTIDRFHRKGDWSDWTDAALPFDDISPPTPLNVEIFPQSTDRVVVAWDDPTINMPTVGTVDGTSGSPTLTGIGTRFDRQVEAGSLVRVDNNNYTVLKIADATSLTLQTNLSTSPSDAILFEVVEDPDISFYAVQLAKFGQVDQAPAPDEWGHVYARDRAEGTRKAFKIPDADTDQTFFARVRSVDAARNRSVWIPAWNRGQHGDVANSDPNVDGDGVVIIPGSSALTTEWVHSGRLNVDSADQDGDGDVTDAIADPYEIPSRFENQTGIKLWFKNVTLNCGDRSAGTGAPTGTGIIVQMRRWNTDGVTADVLFDPTGADHRPRINTNEYHGSQGVNAFEVTHLDPGEAVSCTLFQYGATNPGSNLHVTLTMSPSAPVQH